MSKDPDVINMNQLTIEATTPVPTNDGEVGGTNRRELFLFLLVREKR